MQWVWFLRHYSCNYILWPQGGNKTVFLCTVSPVCYCDLQQRPTSQIVVSGVWLNLGWFHLIHFWFTYSDAQILSFCMPWSNEKLYNPSHDSLTENRRGGCVDAGVVRGWALNQLLLTFCPCLIPSCCDMRACCDMLPRKRTCLLNDDAFNCTVAKSQVGDWVWWPVYIFG